MKLVVKNLGAIKEATIDLAKRYYFFVGYNNTGKTYLAKLIYDIFNHNTLEEFSRQANYHIKENSESLILEQDYIENLLENFAIFLKKTIIPKSLKLSDDNLFIVQGLEIHFIFDMQEEIVKPALHSIPIIDIGYVEKPIFQSYSLHKKENSTEILFEYYDYDFNSGEYFLKDKKIKSDHNLNGGLATSLLNLLLQSKEKPFFLPANRIFLLENAEELVSQQNAKRQKALQEISEFLKNFKDETIDKEKMLSFWNQRTESSHTVHIDHLITKISDLRKNKDADFIEQGNGFYDHLLVDLAKLMGGKISMEKATPLSDWEEKFNFSQAESNKQSSIPMYLGSSATNQLGTLFMFLKYWAKKDDNFLMIDEPEENLHPKSQIKLINLLLEFANKGNRILMTTHSPLITEMLNNYLVASKLDNKPEVVESLGMVDVDLSPKNTAVYYFNGEVVSEHKVFNYGTIFSSFKETQDIIYSVGDYLGELMFKQQNKKN